MIDSILPWIGRQLARYRLREPEDAFQFVVVRHLELFHRWDPNKGALTTWSFQVTRSAVSSWIDQQKRHRHRESIDSSFVDHSTSPFREACRREDIARVRTALAVMPDRERVIVVRRAEGELYNDIGKSLGIARRRVWQVRERALATLEKALRG